MPFPDADRVVFNNNPLVEVVCQLTFKSPYTESDFSDHLIQEVYDRIKQHFPILKSGQQLRLNIDVSGGANNKEEMRSYSFFSEDEDWTVILTRESFVIATRNYLRWEEFYEKLQSFITGSLFQVLSEKEFRRVGLRYKDVIRRSVLSLDTVSWNELLNDQISSLLSDVDLAPHIEGYQSSLNVSLGDDVGFLNANYGIVIHNETKEKCFMIDGDCYFEGDFGYAAAQGKLEQFNACSRKHFRWAIKDKLFQSLEPTSP